jgi:hypothetical protein
MPTNPFNPDQTWAIVTGVALLYFSNEALADLHYMRIGLDTKYTRKHKYRPMPASQMLIDLGLAFLSGFAFYQSVQQTDVLSTPDFSSL